MNKKIIWISSSLLVVLLALGIFGIVSYRSANKFIENIEFDYIKTSESEAFKSFSASLKKARTAIFSPEKDKFWFKFLFFGDENDRKALLDALKRRKIDDFLQIKNKLPPDDPKDIVTIEKPYLVEEPGFFTKIGLFLKKKQTMVSVRKLAEFIRQRLNVPHDENKSWCVILNILNKKAVESFCVESENKTIKSISNSISFTIDPFDEKNNREISDFIAYIIEKNRKKEPNEKNKK